MAFFETKEATDYADRDWSRLMVAQLLYLNPMAKFFDLDEDIHWATELVHKHTGGAAAGGSGPPAFGDLIRLAMKQDTLDLLSKCCQYQGFYNSNWWLPAHLADLFTACGSSGLSVHTVTSSQLQKTLVSVATCSRYMGGARPVALCGG